MSEYIEREALLGKLRERDLCLCVTEREIKDAPAADVAPVVHGRWKQAIYTEAPLYICSYCYKPEYKRHKYCPNCGTKMDKEAPHE